LYVSINFDRQKQGFRFPTLRWNKSQLPMLFLMVILMLILIPPILTSSPQPTSVPVETEGGGLEGTWLNEVKIVTCPPAPPAVIASFQSMITYMRGGTLIEDGSPSFPTAASRSGGHGIWTPTRGHSFHVFLRFHSFDSLGRLVSITEVTTDPSFVNGDLSGNGTNKITNLDPADGSVKNVTEGCNEGISRRFSFEN
jgi:hypothetical protein